MPSHGRGHWFETSSAHQKAAGQVSESRCSVATRGAPSRVHPASGWDFRGDRSVSHGVERGRDALSSARQQVPVAVQHGHDGAVPGTSRNLVRTRTGGDPECDRCVSEIVRAKTSVVRLALVDLHEIAEARGNAGGLPTTVAPLSGSQRPTLRSREDEPGTGDTQWCRYFVNNSVVGIGKAASTKFPTAMAMLRCPVSGEALSFPQ
jgi:hypothetical protein